MECHRSKHTLFIYLLENEMATYMGKGKHQYYLMKHQTVKKECSKNERGVDSWSNHRTGSQVLLKSNLGFDTNFLHDIVYNVFLSFPVCADNPSLPHRAVVRISVLIHGKYFGDGKCSVSAATIVTTVATLESRESVVPWKCCGQQR